MNERIGEINTNTFGTQMKIIAYRSSSDIDVEFLDSHHYIKKNVTYSNFIRGTILNPFDPNTHGIGYTGDGDYLSVDDGKTDTVYIAWTAMLERCYGFNAPKKYSAYCGVTTVCEEWLNFQNFAQWYEDNKYETDGRLHLDKDIKYPGNKVYSPYHCLLVPQRINMLFTNKPNNRGLPNGIHKTKSGRYRAEYNTNRLGTYDTVKEAYAVYSKAKKDTIIQIANEYKDKIPNELYEALLDYEVRIENDKNWCAA